MIDSRPMMRGGKNAVRKEGCRDKGMAADTTARECAQQPDDPQPHRTGCCAQRNEARSA
jgi:hypothetical protein